MNKRKAILLQRLIAGFFLALFLFIHAVKVLHHHDAKPLFVKEAGSQKTIGANADCAICDYYFVKDTSAETALIQLPSPITVATLYTDYLTQRLTSIGLSSSDRGPPSLV